MKRLKNLSALILLTVACVLPQALNAAGRPHVLVISIDGMRPDYVTHADEHQLKIPTLRGFLKEGTFASGVVGVVPTYTYPSHTTLITGVSPSEHGVYNNQRFDPLGTLRGAKYTNSSEVKVETVWHAAHAAGYVTANVGWPLTTGFKDIDYLMPANPIFEGVKSVAEQGEPNDLGVHYDNPPGLREMLAADVPEKPGISIVERRFAWTLAILRRFKPEFMTIHLGGLDHAEHITGPFSKESNQALELIDDEVAQLIALERSIDPAAYIVVVSDHGFFPTEKTVNLGVLFAKQGLTRRATEGQPASWDAAVWPSGGTAAVMLRDPANAEVRAKVESLLQEAAQNPDYGIARILSRDELLKTGGYPEASFLVELKSGFKFGLATKGPAVVSTPNTGAHGFLPQHPELHASFMIVGPGVAAGRNLGVVDMRQVAPTIARILKVPLTTAKLPPLHYEM